MNKRSPVLVATGLLLLILCGALAVFTLTPFRVYVGPTVDSVRADLAKELPNGVDRATVIRALDQRKIEHSGEAAGKELITAAIRNTCWSLVIRCSVMMEFHFDARERLVRSDVFEGLTGP
jgi:hypothetical protein